MTIFKDQIIKGECSEVLDRIDDSVIDLVVTSPPYYNARKYSSWMSYEDYLEFIDEVIEQLSCVMKEGAFICWNVSPHIIVNSKKYNLGFDTQCLLEKYFNMYDIVIWWKKEGGYRLSFGETKFAKQDKDGFRPIKLIPRFEYVFCYVNGKVPEKWKGPEDYERNYWDWGNVVKFPFGKVEGHPAPFSLELPKTMMDWFSKEGDLVLDPFNGSGTTTLAAKQMNRHYIGIEQDDLYCRIAADRMNGLDDEYNHE